MIIEIIGTLICVWIIIVFIRFLYMLFNFKNYPIEEQEKIAEKTIGSALPLVVTFTIIVIIFKEIISWCEKHIRLPPRKEFVK